MNNLLRIEGVNKFFGEQHALKDIHCTIDRGEFVSILGPSGCGKTTLLRVMIGLERPSSGKLFKEELEITELSPDKRGFSIVFQDYALFPHMTLYENVAYGLKLKKVPQKEIKERVMSTLRTLRLAPAVEKYPAQLSGGMQQRAAIARSLVLNSELLLLDEPFSALDAMVKVDLSEELKELQREFSITMVMVTHDQEEAFSLSDRIVLMRAGEIVACDTPRNLYLNEGKDPFIQTFIVDQIDKRGRYIRNLKRGGAS
ncbi:MAG: ABC transporter ATP-binding protein [Clostridiales bacterium]|nr:ABC transporter ATP-binding protein [Clostridiales bacterium]